MNKAIRSVVITVAVMGCVALSAPVFAVPAGGSPPTGGGPPAGGGSGCWPPPCIPIDGGALFLVAAGVLYGGKKLFENR